MVLMTFVIDKQQEVQCKTGRLCSEVVEL